VPSHKAEPRAAAGDGFVVAKLATKATIAIEERKCRMDRARKVSASAADKTIFAFMFIGSICWW
jgi:hypothetical protein